jgi:hypothetical protein
MHYQDFAALKGVTFSEWCKFVCHTSVPFAGGSAPGIERRYDKDVPVTLDFPAGEAIDMLDPANAYYDQFVNVYYEWGKARESRDRLPGRVAKEYVLKHMVRRHTVGLEAVYKLVSQPDLIFSRHDDSDAMGGWMNSFLLEGMVGYCDMARLQPTNALTQAERLNLEHINLYARARLRAEIVRSIIRMRRGRAAVQKCRRFADEEHLSQTVPGIRKEVFIQYIGRLTVMWVGTKHYLLTIPDLDRMQQMFVSEAMYHLALATADSGDPESATDLIRACEMEKDEMWAQLRNLNYAEAQVFCKAKKKAMDLYQSFLAGPLSDERRGDLKADIAVFPSKFGLEDLVVRLRKRSVDVAQESGKVYRLLPAPDYDIGEAFAKRANALRTPNSKGEHIHKNVPLSMDDLRRYETTLILDALASMNGHHGVSTPANPNVRPAWWDDWIMHGRRPGGINWVDEVNLTGIGKYSSHREMDPDVWKDSAACGEEFAEVLADREDPVTRPRNMITRLLRDDNCPTPGTAIRDLVRDIHLLRAGFKMESHKDVARIFYIGNLSDRLAGSEFEDNISSIARHMAGFTVGAKLEDVIERIGRCAAPAVPDGYQVYHISSDYEQWSPGMNSDVQEMSHKLWAEIFDKPAIIRQSEINIGAYLVLNKRGHKAIAKNLEANFEGLNGKEMTALHCALVGYTIYRARLGGLDIPQAEFAAFIDDGALSIVLPKKRGDELFRQFWEYYVETTAFFGFKLDKAKCYLSTRFLIYLNEVYYGGRHVAHGMRAVMKIGTRDATPGETIMHTLDQVGAGCRGAAKCGIHPLQVMKCGILSHAGELYLRGTGKVLSGRAAVLYTYGPKFAHCLQAPIGAQLLCNFTGSGTVEAVAGTNMYARRNPEVKKAYCSLLRGDIRQPSATMVLQNPHTVSPSGILIRANYVQGPIHSGLSEFVTSAFGTQLLAYGKLSHVEDLGKAILKSASVTSTPILDSLADSSLSAIFSGFLRKFDSADTMSKIIGWKTLLNIKKRIASDEESHVYHYVKKILGR